MYCDCVELTEVESFSFLFRNLWTPDKDKARRCTVPILDTILFKDGCPFRWLFTSEETGEVLKKKAEKMTPGEIIRVFKSRVNHYKGFKEHGLKSKIASIWYLTTSSHVSHQLVDEFVLLALLKVSCIAGIAPHLISHPRSSHNTYTHTHTHTRCSLFLTLPNKRNIRLRSWRYR